MMGAEPREASEQNLLTEEEQQAGWKRLLDGKTTQGWRGYQGDKMPPGWKVIDGALVRVDTLQLTSSGTRMVIFRIAIVLAALLAIAIWEAPPQ